MVLHSGTWSYFLHCPWWFQFSCQAIGLQELVKRGYFGKSNYPEKTKNPKPVANLPGGSTRQATPSTANCHVDSQREDIPNSSLTCIRNRSLHINSSFLLSPFRSHPFLCLFALVLYSPFLTHTDTYGPIETISEFGIHGSIEPGGPFDLGFLDSILHTSSLSLSFRFG